MGLRFDQGQDLPTGLFEFVNISRGQAISFGGGGKSVDDVEHGMARLLLKCGLHDLRFILGQAKSFTEAFNGTDGMLYMGFLGQFELNLILC